MPIIKIKQNNAKVIVEEARKRRLAILKKTKEDSASEIDAYKRACEDHMNKMQREYNTGQDLVVNKFTQDTNEKYAELRRQYEANFKLILQTVLGIAIRPKVEYHQNLRP